MIRFPPFRSVVTVERESAIGDVVIVEIINVDASLGEDEMARVHSAVIVERERYEIDGEERLYEDSYTVLPAEPAELTGAELSVVAEQLQSMEAACKREALHALGEGLNYDQW